MLVLSLRGAWEEPHPIYSKILGTRVVMQKMAMVVVLEILPKYEPSWSVLSPEKVMFLSSFSFF